MPSPTAAGWSSSASRSRILDQTCGSPLNPHFSGLGSKSAFIPALTTTPLCLARLAPQIGAGSADTRSVTAVPVSKHSDSGGFTRPGPGGRPLLGPFGTGPTPGTANASGQSDDDGFRVSGRRWLEDRSQFLREELDRTVDPDRRRVIDQEVERVRNELAKHERVRRRWWLLGSRLPHE